LNIGFVLLNDRSAASPSGYNLNFGRIDYAARTVGLVSVASHNPTATYFGANFVHSNRFYYYGSSTNIVTSTNAAYPFGMGFINIYDREETQYSCSISSQVYNFTSFT